MWLGSSCGKYATLVILTGPFVYTIVLICRLMLYDAINKTCVKVANLRDSVLCIE